jgi:hypothetical protein
MTTNMLNHSSPVSWVDINMRSIDAIETSSKARAASQAVVAVTSITNLPIYYAFGKGNAGTTCSHPVNLLFPGLHANASLDMGDDPDAPKDIARWPLHIVSGLCTWIREWIRDSPDTDKLSLEYGKEPNYWPNYFTTYASLAINVLTGQAGHVAYTLEDMKTVLAQTGIIPIMVVFKKGPYDGTHNTSVPFAIISRDDETETYNMVDLKPKDTPHTVAVVNIGNISTIFESCFALVSLNPNLGASWQDLTLPAT